MPFFSPRHVGSVSVTSCTRSLSTAPVLLMDTVVLLWLQCFLEALLTASRARSRLSSSFCLDKASFSMVPGMRTVFSATSDEDEEEEDMSRNSSRPGGLSCNSPMGSWLPTLLMPESRETSFSSQIIILPNLLFHIKLYVYN